MADQHEELVEGNIALNVDTEIREKIERIRAAIDVAEKDHDPSWWEFCYAMQRAERDAQFDQYRYMVDVPMVLTDAPYGIDYVTEAGGGQAPSLTAEHPTDTVQK